MLQSWDKRTPLHVAAQHRQPAVIREILLDPQVRLQLSGPSQHPSKPCHSTQHGNVATPSSSYAHRDQHLQPAVSESAAMGGQAQHQPHLSTDTCSNVGMPHTAYLSQHQLPTASNSSRNALSAQHAQQQQATNSTGRSGVIEVASSQEEDDQMQAAASSLHSLQSGHEDRRHLCVTDRATESAASSMVDDDADALDALLSLTSGCSMQSPVKTIGHATSTGWSLNHNTPAGRANSWKVLPA